MSSTDAPTKRRIAKPLGVYILLPFDFLIFGLLPLVGILIQSREPGFEISLVIITPLVALAVGTMAACVWAWTGDNPARHLVVALVTLSALVYIVLPILGEGSYKFVIRGTFWIVINWWFFFRQSTAAYYKQHTWS